jgi:hypothetical protein
MSDHQTVDQLELGHLVKAAAWKNLMFMKDGRTILGFHVHPTESAAREAAHAGRVELDRLASRNLAERVVKKGTGEHLYFCREYSHSIPVPWGNCEEGSGYAG